MVVDQLPVRVDQLVQTVQQRAHLFQQRLAHRLGKRVDLEMSGGDVELDRSIIEALADPMTHMLRNAVDHGLEEPKGRAVLGKPEAGHISVRAYHERGRVVIEVQDDGRGIDPERVKEAAMARGAITREQAGSLSEKDAVALIFQPGLSTAKEISDVSGRGVGMDVVRTNIQNLGGQIEVASAIGEGISAELYDFLSAALQVEPIDRPASVAPLTGWAAPADPLPADLVDQQAVSEFDPTRGGSARKGV